MHRFLIAHSKTYDDIACTTTTRTYTSIDIIFVLKTDIVNNLAFGGHVPGYRHNTQLGGHSPQGVKQVIFT